MSKKQAAKPLDKIFNKALKQAKIEGIKSDAMDIIYKKRVSIHLVKMLYKQDYGNVDVYNHMIANIANSEYAELTQEEFNTLMGMVEVYENVKKH